MKCPKCGKEIKKTAEVHGTLKAFCALTPIEGLTAYSAYSAPKELICETKTENRNFVHIKFRDGEERLIIHVLPL